MSLVEFRQYVARMGGSLRLFEIRRKQMEAKHGPGDPVAAVHTTGGTVV